MKPQFPHRTIGIEPRSRKDLVAAPHSLQGGHFGPLAIAVTGSGINVEWFLCLLRKTLRSNCHEGNREPSHARTYSVLADCYDAGGKRRCDRQLCHDSIANVVPYWQRCAQMFKLFWRIRMQETLALNARRKILQ
jgi:hypothetical protein